MQDQLLARGLDSSFGTPSVYLTGPDGIDPTSNERIIQRGDFLIIDLGEVGCLNLYTDVKRVAHVLKAGETRVPPGIQSALDQALKVRGVLRRNIEPGPTAAAMLEHLNEELKKAGFALIEFNRPTDADTTDVNAHFNRLAQSTTTRMRRVALSSAGTLTMKRWPSARTSHCSASASGFMIAVSNRDSGLPTSPSSNAAAIRVPLRLR